MRVFLVSHTSELYGAARSLLSLAEGLRADGHELLVSVPQPGPLSGALQAGGIDTVALITPQWAVPPGTSLKAKQWYLRQIVLAARDLAGIIRDYGPDVVHTNSAVIPSGALAARLAGIPHVWHLREQVLAGHDQRFILGRPVTLWLMGTSSSALIAISHSVADDYTTAATKRKLHVVYNGITLPPGLPLPSAPNCTESLGPEPMLALVGVLQPAKGQDEAIRALATLRERGHPCRITLIGGDPVGYGAKLRALVEELDVVPYVTFSGYLPEPLSEMAKADVILMCSRSEAFGRVTVEAMLLGKPVVGANNGGTPEIIEDGRTGLLYPHGNPALLADRIAELLMNPAQIARLGATARHAALSRFSVAQYVNGVEAVYLSVLANRTMNPI